MNETELDRALRAAINVDHSPEFLPRVRARVVVEPRQLWPRWTFALTGAGLAAVALVMAIVGWPDSHRPEATPSPVVIVDTAPVGPPPPSTSPGPVRSRPIVRRRPPVAPDFPEPVISPDDARALEVLVRNVRERRIPEELPLDAVAANGAAALPSIEIPLVTIEPLPEIARLEGDRPR